jgi:hypothetical protein
MDIEVLKARKNAVGSSYISKCPVNYGRIDVTVLRSKDLSQRHKLIYFL